MVKRHGVWLVAMLGTENYSQFATPELVADGVRTAVTAGIDEITIYGLAFTSLAPNPEEAPLDRWLTARALL